MHAYLTAAMYLLVVGGRLDEPVTPRLLPDRYAAAQSRCGSFRIKFESTVDRGYQPTGQ